MTNITICGREIPLLFTTYEMIAIQKEIGCTAAQLRDEVFGLHLEDEDDPKSMVMEVGRDPERMEKLGKLIAILGNAGMEESGESAEPLTAKWILRNIMPKNILGYAFAAIMEINKGLVSETAKEAREETGASNSVVVMEEERKKAQEK